MKEKLVIKSNCLVHASYKLTVVEQKVVLLAITKLDRKDGWVTITATEYAKTYSSDIDNAYGQLRDAIETLANRWGTIYSEALNKPVNFRWIITKKYNDDEGSADIQFHPDLLPYISLLKEKFTQYELKNITGMKSVYAIRFYEMLVQWKRTKNSIEIAIADLKNMFEITEEYKVWSDFKKRVVDVACDQINQFSDLIIALPYGQRRTGRSITHLTFTFDLKPEAKVAKEAKPKPSKTVVRRAVMPAVQSVATNPKPTIPVPPSTVKKPLGEAAQKARAEIQEYLRKRNPNRKIPVSA